MKKRILFTAAALVCAANLTAQCLGVGSSTSSMSPEEMAAAAKAGVEYVEIGISGRGTVAEIREKALHAKRMADEAGLKVWSCHLPFSRKLDISVLNDSARMANLEFLTEMIAICGEVGPGETGAASQFRTDCGRGARAAYPEQHRFDRHIAQGGGADRRAAVH